MESIWENEAFKNIEPEKLAAVREMALEIQGKSPPEIMVAFAKYSKILNQGKPIAPEERNAMIEVVLSGMAPEERKKYEAIVNMVKSN